jgi:hypothetical protein
MPREGEATAARRGRPLAAAVAAVAACVLAVCAPGAFAQVAQNGTGGAAPAPAATAEPTPEPRALPPVRSRVRIARLVCVTGCASSGAVQPGALLRVRGAGMKRADEVAFDGAEGADDDVSAAPVKRRKRSLDVRVPLGAVSGPVVIADRDGVASKPSPAPLAVEAMPAHSGGPSIDVDVQAPRAYFDAARPMRASYVVHDSQPVSVQVELVREEDGAVIARWAPGEVQPNTPQAIQWDGLAGGQVQREGRYSFRVSATDAAGLRASSAQSEADGQPGLDPDEFVFLRHQFPVRGPHGFGDVAASFGGGRGHQGQDIFAACGTPVVAARGGIVKLKQYHSRAGHYIVMDGEKTGVDYAYMHLRDAALVARGERVRTGQVIGFLGDTGRASACHLHFETWDQPGWYSGGVPMDPLPSLLAWDALS